MSSLILDEILRNKYSKRYQINKDVITGGGTDWTNDPFELDMAKLTAVAYSNNRMSFNGYKYIEEFSTAETAVYQKNDTVYISFRGTSNLKDVVTDVKLIKGEERTTNRFQKSYKLAQDFKAKGFKVVVVGHSMGATIGFTIGERDPTIEVYGFNIGSTPNIMRCIGRCPNIHLFNTSTDFASVLTRPIKKLTKMTIKTIPSKYPFYKIASNHSVANFF
tara:strand:+ start:195 stop:851 length:657 start_codon:yes stop_codon:yes gene_type:complete